MTSGEQRGSWTRIVLTGFMGSGKTTVGRRLAQRLDWTFADLDEHVVAREGLSVPAIFAMHGENFFRQAEVRALRNLLVKPQTVIALGGGAPETPAVRDLLASAADTVVLHLHAPFEVLYDRCLVQARNPGATERPLARERTAAMDRYARRASLYAAAAHHSVDVETGSPDAIAEAILRVLDPQARLP